jgi:hypothetical protein
MIDVKTAFGHKLFEVAVAEAIAELPADAEEDDLG